MLEKVTNNCDKEFLRKSAVRQLCKYRKQWGLAKFRNYISDKPNLHQYFDDYLTQYQRGNRGEWNTWI